MMNRSKKYGVTFIDGSRSYLENCDTFTLAIHFPGERGTQESTSEMLAECIRERSLRRLMNLFRDEGKDVWINIKIRDALAIQLRSGRCVAL